MSSAKSSCTAVSRYLEHAACILQGMFRLRSRRQLCDVVLRVGSRQIFAHRAILAANCAYFRAMFTSGLSECDQKSVLIKGLDGEAVDSLVEFIYTSNLNVRVDNVIQLLTAADCFQLASAKVICVEFLKQHLSVTNCLEIREYADHHFCADLEFAARAFAHSNFGEVAKTEEFLHVEYEDILALITNDFLKVESEEEVFEAVVNWVKHDLPSRRWLFSRLLSHVRLPFVATEFLADRIATDCLVQEDKVCQELVHEAFTYLLSPRQRPVIASLSQRAQPRRMSSLQQMVIAVGGQSVQGTLQSAEQYNPSLDEWQPMPDLTFERYGLALLCCDNRLHAFGGCSSSSGFQTAVEVFSSQIDKWQIVMGMQPRRYFGAVEVCGMVYMAGGHNGTTTLSTLECFDPSTKSWLTLASLSSPRLYPGLVNVEGNLFVVGGHCGKVRLDSVESYNIQRDEWQIVASLPTPSSVVATVAVSNFVYAIGGYNGESHLSTVSVYSPEVDKWTIGPTLRLPRSAAAAVECGGCIYVCGGFNGTFLNSVERLDPRTRDWCAVGAMSSSRAHFAATLL